MDISDGERREDEGQEDELGVQEARCGRQIVNHHGADQSAENGVRVNVEKDAGESDDGRKCISRGEGERGEGVEGAEGDRADEVGKRVVL